MTTTNERENTMGHTCPYCGEVACDQSEGLAVVAANLRDAGIAARKDPENTGGGIMAVVVGDRLVGSPHVLIVESDHGAHEIVAYNADGETVNAERIVTNETDLIDTVRDYVGLVGA